MEDPRNEGKSKEGLMRTGTRVYTVGMEMNHFLGFLSSSCSLIVPNLPPGSVLFFLQNSALKKHLQVKPSSTSQLTYVSPFLVPPEHVDQTMLGVLVRYSPYEQQIGKRASFWTHCLPG